MAVKKRATPDEDLCSKMKITSAELKALRRAAWTTYDAISFDLVGDNDSDMIKRDDLIDVILDADHLELNGFTASNKLTTNLKRVLNDKSPLMTDLLVQALRSAFIYNKYQVGDR